MTLKTATEILRQAKIDSPEHDAREIFRAIIGDPILLDTEHDDPRLAEYVGRRANREPLQYILGSVGFYREEYFVTPDVLIPRSDTETLVDFAIKNIPAGARFLDLCTGSGCIAISTLKNTKETTAVAVDLSEAALAVARKNAEGNGVCDRIALLRADAREELDTGEIFALLSNPPYVAESVYETLETEIFHEPKMAFVGGEDGGDFYRAITPIYRDKIAEEGFIAYEIGYDQAELLGKIAEECNMSCEIIRDLSGNDRVAVLRRSK